ncbi:hypothetical protein HNV11_18790 [Spirosoma taeanense]|uniref:Deoxyribose-phosphate aldolase n=1 Tax=Spirosoma taeanense TaxID=2735870 RepID=A0A6M5YD86_9BACT|nr:DUF6503 family protein [Spirosoma taeanense]QJW91276.1 hypothetical protein HNV11_18790 [Spirosoma taeanense]
MLLFIRYTCFALILLVVACQSKHDARTIISQAIDAHGGDAYQNKRIEFDFRQFHLVLDHKNDRFRYERTHKDSSGATIREVLTNTNFSRFRNGQRQTLDTAQTGKYSRAVNSIAYFVLLPFKLNDPAVLADYVGESQIDGQTYDKIRVRFRVEGGGKDYQDTFFYWFNRQTHTMDYLAYSEGGPRFRKAINPQTVGGIRFQDYINYKGDEHDTVSVGNYDQKYQAHQLAELSRIEQKYIRVTELP